MSDYKNETKSLRFLYNTAVGRCFLKLLVNPALSKLAGFYMDTHFSTIHINGFIKNNNIDLREYERKRYTSFNDCFTRKIKASRRPVDMSANAFVSPCDGKLSAYRINEDSVFDIKHSKYSIKALLNDEKYADEFADGTCLIFRLCVNNYHRYGYVDNGRIADRKVIKGILHTVRPIATEQYPVFVQNARESTIIDTDNFGRVAQIEVGAMFIGKIKNHKKSGRVIKGKEKGMFLYGGSTIVVLLKKDAANIKKLFFENTANGIETDVLYGQTLN